MGTLKKKMRTIHKRMKSDFSIIDMEVTKQAFGMGKSDMPAFSLFAMPAMDLGSSGGRVGAAGRG
jgi:hypothetical protein